MLSFRDFLLLEGGNVVIGDQEADRIDLKKISRKAIVASLEKSLGAMNADFRKQTGFPLWNEKLFKSKEFLSGSALHFFKVNEIDDDTFVAVKDSVGDIDTQVNGLHKDAIRKWLDSVKGKTFGDLTAIGYKVSANQYISLWRSKEFGINIQIDLELVDFDAAGNPTPWSRFNHSSAWDDMLLGIKGVAHKYMLRAMNARKLKEVIIQPRTARGTEKVVLSAEQAFSPSGLRMKLKPVLDEKGKQLMKNGRPVYQELKTSETGFVTDLEVIFEAFFDRKPSKQDLAKLESFVGIIDLVKRYIPKSDQVKIADGFANTLWGNAAQNLYRNDPERDLREKTIMAELIAKEFGIDSSRWDDLKARFYK